MSMDRALSKACWLNYVYIIKEMPYSKKLDEIDILFEFLKDMNWPVAKDSMDVIGGLKREDIIFSIEKFLLCAYKEKDYMWISGIYVLTKQVGLSKDDFVNKDILKIFQYRDF